MSQLSWGDQQTQFFYSITPEVVLNSVEATGYYCTGMCFALNSMENRVYDVEIELDESDDPREVIRTPSESHRIAKFYRPGRWSKEQILEEHEFLLDLQAQEIPAIAPLQFDDGSTLKTLEDSGIHYAIFPKVGGRAPDELSDDQLTRVGRLLARIHNAGSAKQAPNRLRIHPDTYGMPAIEFLLKQQSIPPEFESRYQKAITEICDISRPWFEGIDTHRIHGDCHFGNLLWNDQGPFFLDFDDMVVGPAIQDLWLIVPGRDQYAQDQFRILLAAYEQMREFDPRTLRLVEPLRALRLVHFCAWIAKRWDDPAFPQAFPQYGSQRYWQEQTQYIEEQWRLILEVSQASSF